MHPENSVEKRKENIGCTIEILKRAHGKATPKTNYQDTKPTTNPRSKTLLENCLPTGQEPKTA